LSTTDALPGGAPKWRADALVGAWQMLPLLIGVIPFGLLLGAVSAEKGFSPLETTLMSGLVFAGSSQFVAVQMWQHPLPLLAIVASAALINSRHLLMGAALEPHMRGFRRGQAYAALFFMADENWAMSLRRAADGSLTPAYYFGQVIPFYVSWLFWTTTGNVIGRGIAHPERYGFDFAFSAVFLVLIFGFWKRERRLLPIVVSAAAALLVWRIAPGIWYIFAGGVAGTAAAAIAARPSA